MRTVLLQQDVNPTSVNKCMNTSIYSMNKCVLCYFRRISKQMQLKIYEYFKYCVCMFVYCYCRRVTTQKSVNNL